MNKIIIFFIINITSTFFIKSAALIPSIIKSKATHFTKKTSRNLFGEPFAEKLIVTSKIGKGWVDWYTRSITNPTPNELIQNSLFYSIEYGTRQSITGENHYKKIRKYYQNYYQTPLKNIKH